MDFINSDTSGVEMRLQAMVHNPLLQEALKEAERLLNHPTQNNWVKIETIDLGPVLLNYGTIHNNGMHERSICTIAYEWFNGEIISVRSAHA